MPNHAVNQPTCLQAGSVCLLLPGLLRTIASASTGLEPRSVSRLLSHASVVPVCSSSECPDFEQLTIHWFNSDADTQQGCAARLGYALEIDPQAAPDLVLRADPVYQQIDQQQVVLADPAVLDLNINEARQLVESLNSHLAQDNLTLRLETPQRWYLCGDTPVDVDGASPALAIGRSVARYPLTGRDARRWQGLLAELQMVLFEHPVNLQRQQAGQLPVNSVWFWGQGEPQRRFGARGFRAQSQGRVYTDDFYVSSVAAYAQLPVVSLDAIDWGDGRPLLVADGRLQTALNTGDAEAFGALLDELNTRVFKPLWRNLSAGRVRTVWLWTGQHCYHLDYKARRRFWRRIQAFSAFVENTDAN